MHVADLDEGVTDDGINALAVAGCGTNLISLALRGEWGCRSLYASLLSLVT